MNQPIMSLDQYISQITQQLRTSIKAACIMYGDAEALAEVESQLTPVLTEIEDKLTELHAVPGDDELDKAEANLDLNDVAIACSTCDGLGEITIRGVEVECSRCKGSGQVLVPASSTRRCPKCNGSGNVDVSDEPCNTSIMDCLKCGGSGFLPPENPKG